MPTILPVKSPSYGFLHYSNAKSQGTLITQAGPYWPECERDEPRVDRFERFMVPKELWDREAKPVHIADDEFDVGSDYMDRMTHERRQQLISMLRNAVKERAMSFHDCLSAVDGEALIEITGRLLHLDVVSVRWVYFFNEATFYDCERIDYIYRIPKLESSM